MDLSRTLPRIVTVLGKIQTCVLGQRLGHKRWRFTRTQDGQGRILRETQGFKMAVHKPMGDIMVGSHFYYTIWLFCLNLYLLCSLLTFFSDSLMSQTRITSPEPVKTQGMLNFKLSDQVTSARLTCSLQSSAGLLLFGPACHFKHATL